MDAPVFLRFAFGPSAFPDQAAALVAGDLLCAKLPYFPSALLWCLLDFSSLRAFSGTSRRQCLVSTALRLSKRSQSIQNRLVSEGMDAIEKLKVRFGLLGMQHFIEQVVPRQRVARRSSPDPVCSVHEPEFPVQVEAMGDMPEESLDRVYENSSESCSSAADDTIQKRSLRVQFFTGSNPDFDFWEDCQNGESSLTDPTRLSLADTGT